MWRNIKYGRWLGEGWDFRWYIVSLQVASDQPIATTIASDIYTVDVCSYKCYIIPLLCEFVWLELMNTR